MVFLSERCTLRRATLPNLEQGPTKTLSQQAQIGAFLVRVLWKVQVIPHRLHVICFQASAGVCGEWNLVR